MALPSSRRRPWETGEWRSQPRDEKSPASQYNVSHLGHSVKHLPRKRSGFLACLAGEGYYLVGLGYVGGDGLGEVGVEFVGVFLLETGE